ncbi:MAG: nucleoside hydrolase [Actinobacteria bacterium]|nr:nucleoside hydrolase [Actinomycetota bacterium]
MKKNLILDVDTGVDDAFAILFAARHPEINLLGITCVDGNTNLENVIANTLKTLDAAGAGDIPVARGATRPLIDEPRYAEFVHGSDGLLDMGIPPSKRVLDPRPAVELIRDLIEGAAGPVTLIPLAPLTNIALFLRAFPDTAAKLERIVLMGGSASAGNATATAEFNIWHDPEAAAIVFSSGIPITMYGLDVFTRLQLTHDHGTELKSREHECSQFSGELIQRFVKQFTALADQSEITLGDYGAVATAIAPHLVTMERYRVVVDTTFGPNRGQTVCDRRTFADSAQDSIHSNAPSVDVVMDLDVDAITEMWMRTITQ